jgi:hypothetical protein
MGTTEDDADLMLVSGGFGESMCPLSTFTPSPALVASITAPTLTSTRLPTLVATAPDPLSQASGRLTFTPTSAVSAAVVVTTGPTLIPTHLPTTSPTRRGPTSQPSVLID